MSTYVFDNVEVKKTGRTATRVLKSSKIDKLFEITPVDENVGRWKKWVHSADLFAVVEDDNHLMEKNDE